MSNILLIIGKKNLLLFFAILTFNIFQIILEILSIGLILPILSVIVNQEIIFENKYLFIIYQNINATDPNDFLKKLLIFLFFLYSLKIILIIFFKFLHIRYQNNLIKYLSVKIISNYLTMDYYFFLKNKNSKLISNLYNECKAFVDWYISPLIVIFSELIFALLLLTFLSIVDFKSTFLIFIAFGFFGFIFLNLTRRKIGAWGKDRSALSEKIIHNLNQIFDGIKLIKIFQKENYFINLFNKDQSKVLSSLSKNDLISFLPRVFLEYLIVILLIIVLFFNLNKTETIINLIPLIGLYTAAVFKLMPCVTKIMISYQNLKFGSPAVKTIFSETQIISDKNDKISSKNLITDFEEINFKNIGFSYDKNTKVISNLNFNVTKGEFIGLIGETGSGKTTFLNIILGLLSPASGSILIDGKDYTKNYHLTKKIFSLSGQENFLFDETILQNITLENDEKKIDWKKLEDIKKLSQIENMIDQLENKENSLVGENGLFVSGGQKQRISLARALYHDSKIIVLDEITSNLDENTEEKILTNLIKLKGEKTIIFVTHNKGLLKICDKIYKMENQKINLLK